MKNTKAKLFYNGGSQAVRLPKAYRFPESPREVNIRREGRRIVLEPLSEWSDAFRACLGMWSDDIPRLRSGRRENPKNPFS